MERRFFYVLQVWDEGRWVNYKEYPFTDKGYKDAERDMANYKYAQIMMYS